MANTLLSLLLLSATATAIIFTVGAGYAGGEGSIHELLREHGLPAGLLPNTVESYTLDSANGILEVRLDRPCYAKYDGLTFFDQVVRGNLSYGALGSVSGLKQEELFLWLPVRGILLTNPSSGVILFDIGVAHKQLSLSLFEVPPDCRPAEGAAEVAIGGIREITKGLLGRRGGISGSEINIYSEKNALWFSLFSVFLVVALLCYYYEIILLSVAVN